MIDYQARWGDAWKRVRIIMIIVVAAALLLAGKLAWIQLVRHETYTAMVNQQNSIELPLIEVRGDILDRNFKKIVNQQKCVFFYLLQDFSAIFLRFVSFHLYICTRLSYNSDYQ